MHSLDYLGHVAGNANGFQRRNQLRGHQCPHPDVRQTRAVKVRVLQSGAAPQRLSTTAALLNGITLITICGDRVAE